MPLSSATHGSGSDRVRRGDPQCDVRDAPDADIAEGIPNQLLIELAGECEVGRDLRGDDDARAAKTSIASSALRRLGNPVGAGRPG